MLQQGDPALQADGHEVIAVQYGLDSFEEDVATVKRTLNRVGHSYGGATITAKGVDERVIGLVYVAAVAPDIGETVQDQLEKYPSDIFSGVEVADGPGCFQRYGILCRRSIGGRAQAHLGHPLCARL